MPSGSCAAIVSAWLSSSGLSAGRSPSMTAERCGVVEVATVRPCSTAAASPGRRCTTTRVSPASRSSVSSQAGWSVTSTVHEMSGHARTAESVSLAIAFTTSVSAPSRDFPVFGSRIGSTIVHSIVCGGLDGVNATPFPVRLPGSVSRITQRTPCVPVLSHCRFNALVTARSRNRERLDV